MKAPKATWLGGLWNKMSSGIVVPGNINLANRPQVKNPDGTVSTVLSTSFNQDGLEVLVPRVMDNGTVVSPQEAWVNYLKTGKHLGKFNSVDAANKYAEFLHKNQEKLIKTK